MIIQYYKISCYLFLASTAFILLGCTTTKEIQVRAIDYNSKALPNSVIFVEITVKSKAIDFAFASFDKKGKIQNYSNWPLKFKWKWNSKMAVLYYAKDKNHNLVFDHSRKMVDAKFLESNLEPIPDDLSYIIPNTLRLDFPYSDNSKLNQRLKDKNAEPLLRAFIDLYGRIKAERYQDEKNKKIQIIQKYLLSLRTQPEDNGFRGFQ